MSRTFKYRLFMVALFAFAFIGLTACSGSGSASSKTVDVQVTLSEFKIAPSITTFKVGVPYHFVVTNNGSVAHELDIIPPESGQLTPDQVQKLSLATIGEKDLQPGATATLDYTFSQAYSQGALELACHLPGHYEAGMHIPIVVTR